MVAMPIPENLHLGVPSQHSALHPATQILGATPGNRPKSQNAPLLRTRGARIETSTAHRKNTPKRKASRIKSIFLHKPPTLTPPPSHFASRHMQQPRIAAPHIGPPNVSAPRFLARPCASGSPSGQPSTTAAVGLIIREALDRSTRFQRKNLLHLDDRTRLQHSTGSIPAPTPKSLPSPAYPRTPPAS